MVLGSEFSPGLGTSDSIQCCPDPSYFLHSLNTWTVSVLGMYHFCQDCSYGNRGPDLRGQGGRMGKEDT